MKSLVQFIKEAKLKSAFNGKEFFTDYYWKMGYKYYNNETDMPTDEEIENAFGTTSNVTGDPSFCCIDDVNFTKLNDTKWQSNLNLPHAIGGKYTNKEIIDLLKNTKEKWYMMLRFTEKK